MVSFGLDTWAIRTYGHVTSVSLRTNLANKRRSGVGDEVDQRLLLNLLLEDFLALVKRLVNNNAGLLDTLGLGHSGVIDGTKEIVVTESLGDLGEGLVRGLVLLVEESHQDDLVCRLEVLDCVLGENGNGGHGLLGHVGDDTATFVSNCGSSEFLGDNSRVSFPLALVRRNILDAAEDLEGRVALNAVV